MFIKSNNIIAQQAQHIYTAPIQRRTSVEDAGPMLHQCHTNALRPLRGSTGPVPFLCWRTKNQHRLSTSYIQQTRRLDQRWGKVVLALTWVFKYTFSGQRPGIRENNQKYVSKCSDKCLFDRSVDSFTNHCQINMNTDI